MTGIIESLIQTSAPQYGKFIADAIVDGIILLYDRTDTQKVLEMTAV
jgi:hypothetical protein